MESALVVMQPSQVQEAAGTQVQGKMVRPYTQVTDGSVIIRTFSDASDAEELSWHRDEHDREVTVLSCDGWKFQYDNGLPIDMNAGDTVQIPRDSWHRIIKGTGDLVVKIRERSDI